MFLLWAPQNDSRFIKPLPLERVDRLFPCLVMTSYHANVLVQVSRQFETCLEWTFLSLRFLSTAWTTNVNKGILQILHVQNSWSKKYFKFLQAVFHILHYDYIKLYPQLWNPVKVIFDYLLRTAKMNNNWLTYARKFFRKSFPS